MFRRLAWFVVAIPAGVILIVAMFANKHWVTLNLDPFREVAESVVTVQLPLYAYLMLALVAGVVLGGMATWFSQGRWRKTARQRGQEAMRWEAEADRLSRERDGFAAASQSSGQLSSQSANSRAIARIGGR